AFWIAVVAYTATQALQQDNRRAERWLLLGVGLTLIVAFIVTPFGADPSGRYFVPLAFPLALFGGAFLGELGRRTRWLAGGLLGIALAFNLWGTVQCALRYPPGLTTQFHAPTQINHAYDDELIAFLRNTGATNGYTNYWVA